jgi:hypothetical protein
LSSLRAFAREDLADFIEDVRRFSNEGRTVMVLLKLAESVFWTGLNTIGYVMGFLGLRPN